MRGLQRGGDEMSWIWSTRLVVKMASWFGVLLWWLEEIAREGCLAHGGQGLIKLWGFECKLYRTLERRQLSAVVQQSEKKLKHDALITLHLLDLDSRSSFQSTVAASSWYDWPCMRRHVSWESPYTVCIRVATCLYLYSCHQLQSLVFHEQKWLISEHATTELMHYKSVHSLRNQNLWHYNMYR